MCHFRSLPRHKYWTAATASDFWIFLQFLRNYQLENMNMSIILSSCSSPDKEASYIPWRSREIFPCIRSTWVRLYANLKVTTLKLGVIQQDASRSATNWHQINDLADTNWQFTGLAPRGGIASYLTKYGYRLNTTVCINHKAWWRSICFSTSTVALLVAGSRLVSEQLRSSLNGSTVRLA